ncbi:MAG: PDR/VanB family oxidoreductase [Schumannella sp.]|nr:oxidoreductase [Microbacteriaceae bacterium]
MNTSTGFAPFRATAIDRHSASIVTVDLHPVTPSDGFPVEPGAHIEVGIGDDLVRQYSACDALPEGGVRIGVLRERESRGGSHWMHDSLRVGDVLPVRGPLITFPFHAGRDPVLFIAGGIGITALLRMLDDARRTGRPWRMLYAGRGADRMPFTDRLASGTDGLTLHDSSVSGPLDLAAWLAASMRDEFAGAHVYACGPARMLEELRVLVPSSRLHTELFRAAATAASGPDEAFTVETRDGSVLEVPADGTILGALIDAGVPVLNSCREGICGTCETRILAGVPDHRDSVLTDEERASGETMMVCVSRSAGGPLRLDV